MCLKLNEPTGATPLTPDEMFGLKARHITNRGELNELEGENIIEGFDLVGATAKILRCPDRRCCP